MACQSKLFCMYANRVRYYFDLIYISWFVQITTIFSDWIWLTYLLVRQSFLSIRLIHALRFQDMQFINFGHLLFGRISPMWAKYATEFLVVTLHFRLNQ